MQQTLCRDKSSQFIPVWPNLPDSRDIISFSRQNVIFNSRLFNKTDLETNNNTAEVQVGQTEVDHHSESPDELRAKTNGPSSFQFAPINPAFKIWPGHSSV